MSRTFFASLALATAIPLIALPLYGLIHVSAPMPAVAVVLAIWVLAGYGHVMSTVWFGLDADYRPVIRAHRLRMLASLGVIPLAMALVALADRAVSSWIYAAFLVWQAHHFARQNYGVLSLAAAHDKAGPLPKDVSLMVNLTSAAGAVGMVTMPSIFPGGLKIPPLASPAASDAAHVLGLLFLGAAAIVAVRLLVRDSRLRRSPTVLLFLGLSGVFFIPSLLPGAPPATFWPFAIAHGSQYLIIMAHTARQSPRGRSGLGLFALATVVLGAGAISLPGLVLKQAYTGVVIWHFLADARLWRLRDPVVRGIVRRRFAFIFDPSPPPVRPGMLGQPEGTA